jgi:ribokinase
MGIVVFGSINMDLVARAPHLPSPGETLIGHQFATVPGGKGANQAVAVARLGHPVEMVGRVGGDRMGEELVTSLQQDGVGCAGVAIAPDTTSGVAVIAVDDQAENTIIVIPGANGQVGTDDLHRLRQRLPAEVLLLQLEIPLPALIEAVQIAYASGTPVILDPAPARSDLPHDLFPMIDILTPNQGEAERLVGFPVNSIEAAKQAAIALHQRGVGTVLLKLGRQGALCVSENTQFHIPAFEVEAIDTVAAGDAFNGGLAVAIADGQSLPNAVRWASAVAALSTTVEGAQPSLPTRQAVEQFLTSNFRQTTSLPNDR